ncbi:MAG: lipoyl synthase [Candidatus Diapherotrites archaeon]
MKPGWLKVKIPTQNGIKNYSALSQTITKTKLNTVCTEARCPNMFECWSNKTASFMVLGNICTRGCRFCSVKTSKNGAPLDENEPKNLAKAVKEFNLGYVVITSVDRDDLADFGAGHFSKCVKEIKKQNPKIIIELLIPDFNGNKNCLDAIIKSNPNVIGHNIETVKRLQEKIRDRKANYSQSLNVLKYIKKNSPKTFTKSSLMLGLGETEKEILGVMDDLRKIKVDFLALGQYLQPTKKQLEVKEFVSPEKFEFYRQKALEKGFLFCASGPFVRTSYNANEFFIKKILAEKV